MMLEVGTLVNNRYTIDGLIGRGGMSRVYIATDKVSGTKVAVKEAVRNGIQDQQIIQLSLAAEGMLLKSLSNPHLPRIYDVLETPESIMIVMDYVQGESLDIVVEKCGVVDAVSVIEWAIQICDVLTYLHSQTPPVIYRDLKPANVILRPDGFIMMVDFGTARKWTSENKTSDTILIGTEGFAAPEQYGGLGQSDARTDIFCLGATVFNLVTGHNPYEKPYGVTHLGVWNPDLAGSPIDKVVQKCVAKDPNDRFQNAEELKEAFIAIRGNKASTGVLSRMKISPKRSKGWQTPAMETAGFSGVQEVGDIRKAEGIVKSSVQEVPDQVIIKEGGTKTIEPEPEKNTGAAYMFYSTEMDSVRTQNISETEANSGDSKSKWKLVMITGFAGAAVVIILGLVILLAAEGSILLPGIIILVFLIILAGIGIFALTKYIK